MYDTNTLAETQSISEWLIEKVSIKTGRKPEEIESDASFSILGIESMVLVGIIADLSRLLGRRLQPTIGFDYPTITALADHVTGGSDMQRSGYPLEPPKLSVKKSEKSVLEPASSEWQYPQTPYTPYPVDPIAVVGIGCRFPGGCDDPETFWRFLDDRGDGITEVPADRWDVDLYYEPDKISPGKMNTRWGGFLDRIDQFDPTFFGMSPREARGVDPQQRLVLQVSWEALENAGEIPFKLKESRTGVFVGISGSDYGRLLFKDPTRLDLYSGTGNSTSIAANRLSYYLGLRGPSMAIDTACSSSLVAVDLACKSLHENECNMAIAGGVNLILSPEMTIIFSQAKLMAPDGRCKTFDASANGYVRSEGCGMVVLKKYSDAVRDGNPIYGLIRSTHVNQDGESNGLTVPNGLAQQTLIRESLKKAGIEPWRIGYAETHGTGTVIGDPIEVNSLGVVLGENRTSENPLVIGSLKANIGHLEQAAGIASLIKVLLSLKHNKIPAHLHFKTVNPLIDLDCIPAIIPKKAMSWTPNSGKRFATVSGFSFGGVNAHVVVEESPAIQLPEKELQRPYHLLTLSARTEKALLDMTGQYEAYLEAHPETDAEDFCYTANACRSDFSWRLALQGKNTLELKNGLTAFSNKKPYPGSKTGKARPDQKTAFLFTGQGSQYPEMGRELYLTQPVFRQAMDRCNEIIEENHQISLLSLLYDTRDASQLNQTANTQPALFCLEYSLAVMYQSWGIEPAIVMGHSVGEYVAACISGIFSLEDGLKLITARGRLIQALPEGGKMAAFFTNAQVVETAIHPYSDLLSVAAYNGPENIVVSGEGDAVDNVMASLTSQGVPCVELAVSHGFHSAQMEPMLDDFRKIAESVVYKAGKIPFVSNVTGRRIDDKEVCTADYWCRHIRSSVQFEAGVRTLQEQGCDLLLELGPNPVLTGMAREFLLNEPMMFASSLKKGTDDWRCVMESLGTLYVAGVSINWQELNRPFRSSVLPIPTYPFQNQKCWFEELMDGVSQPQVLKPKASAFHPSQGTRLKTPLKDIVFHYSCSTDSYFLDEHRVYTHAVVSGSTLVSMVIHKMEELFGSGAVQIESMFIKEPLHIPEDQTGAIQVVFSKDDHQAGSFKIFSTIEDDEIPDSLWHLHTEGTIKIARNEDKHVPHAAGPFSPESIRNRCPEEVDADPLYEQIWQGGLQLGNHFKWLEKIWRRDGEALAQMRLPGHGEEYENGHIPPGLIDSCIQLLFACLPLNKETAYMFLGFDSFIYYGHPSGRLFCHIELQTDISEKDLVIGDYRLWSENGALVAEARGVHLKQALPEALLGSLRRTAEKDLYNIEWELAGPKKPEQENGYDQSGKWLILTDSGPAGTYLAEKFESQGVPFIIINSGDTSESVDRNNYEKLEHIFEELFAKEDFSGIVNLWGVEGSLPETLFNAPSSRYQDITCGSTLCLVRVLSKLPRSKMPKLWLVTCGVQQTGPNDPPVNPHQALLWGMGKVIAIEHPELWGGLVDLASCPGKSDVSQLVQDLIHPDGEKLISIRGEKRYLARLKPVSETIPSSGPLSFPKDATYLITGGLGGLGMGLARWLSEKGAGNLVLMGRKTPSAEVEKHIRDIENRGTGIRVIQADVADGAALEKAFNEIHRTMPALKGVFHLAGIIDDGMLFQMEWSRLAQVLTPKVKGAWNLHLLTKNLPLEYVVFFSSVASLIGSPGQGSYAAANHFMDTLSEIRKKDGLPALSINWGPWAGSGMTAGLESGDLKRWEKGGLSLLKPDWGFNLLERALQSGQCRMGALHANWDEYVKYYLNNIPSPLLSHLVSKPSGKRHRSEPDRDSVLERIGRSRPEERRPLIEKNLSHHVIDVMWLDPESPVDPDTPLMEIGLDSLMVIELRNRLKKDFKVELPLTEFLKSPTITKLSENILNRLADSKPAEIKEVVYPKVIHRPDQRHEPFPLTDIQHAYWIGRSNNFELGNVSCHVYPEVEIEDLDIDGLNKAISRLMTRHDMLRAVISNDGRQRIQEKVPPYEIQVQDLRGGSPEYIEEKLNEVRHQMSHQIRPAETGPLFEIRASLLDNGITRLHISFDLLIGDGWSFNILISDLYKYYLDPDADLPPHELTFRDYVLAERALKDSGIYENAMEYWKKRLPGLPSAPDLPLAKKPGEIKNQRFVRLKSRMEKDQWKHLKQRAAKAGLTPSGVLLAAFSDILACWSKSPDFTINLTMFNRLPLHEQVNEIVGDFTTLTLLEVNHDAGRTFEERAGKIQERLWEDLEHRYVTGVAVLRELVKQRGGDSNITFPVVFTSVLPYSGSADNATAIGLPADLPIDMVYCISQTPQVWLDHQIFEMNGALTFNWDALEEIFPERMLEDMFDAYCKLINRLATEETVWQKADLKMIPELHLQTRALLETTAPVSQEMLHTLFDMQVSRNPDQNAVVFPGKTLTYKDLSILSNTLGMRLVSNGSLPNTVIGVVMKKGWEQVAGVLGILKSGAAYLPIDPDMPAERINTILLDAKVELVLTQSGLEKTMEWPSHVKLFSVDKIEPDESAIIPPEPKQCPDDLAYVIYTSGSTGKPKGVMINHRGAVNTILDINQRFEVHSDDRVLALSNLSFDLSVFDIFGLLAAGGTVVVPPPEAAKDPELWSDMMIRENITLWNTAPALMAMLVEHCKDRPDLRFDQLNHVMLSGDWIPVDLPEKISLIAENAKIHSLGGATEVSIWSVMHSITTFDNTIRSIPYGRPLTNQTCRVLSAHMADCPDWVTGDLYIGGTGLAQGYLGDQDKTNQAFILHPETRERLYRTGDMARYLPNGLIELIGREDNQIKLNGHRIELGEIEAALVSHPAVRESVAALIKIPDGEKRIVAYIVPESSAAVKSKEGVAQESFKEVSLKGVSLTDPIKRLHFKSLRAGLRQLPSMPSVSCGTKNTSALSKRFSARSSIRSFNATPLSDQDFFEWLALLSSVPASDSPFPKYAYGSAGGLYPVQIYLHVKKGAIYGLDGGDYYYNPDTYTLTRFQNTSLLDPGVFAGNDSIYKNAAFAVFLVADYDAIEPMYGVLSRDFCLIEAGLMSQVMESNAHAYGIGLCQIGVIDFNHAGDRFQLSPRQKHIHTLLGGALPPGHAGSLGIDDLETSVKSHLRRRLPAYMIPSDFVILDKMPLSSNGKVDRKSLPLPDISEPAKVVEAERPIISGAEHIIIDAFKDVLKLNEVSADRNFFDLGADSLRLVTIRNHLQGFLNRDIPIVLFFEHPTARELAQVLDISVPIEPDDQSVSPRKPRSKRQRRPARR